MICPLCEQRPVQIDGGCAECWLILQRLERGEVSVEARRVHRRLVDLRDSADVPLMPEIDSALR